MAESEACRPDRWPECALRPSRPRSKRGSGSRGHAGSARPRKASGPPTEALPRHCDQGAPPADQRRLDLGVYGASQGEALCCDVTLVFPLQADGRPHPGAARNDRHVLHNAWRRRFGTPSSRAVGAECPTYVRAAALARLHAPRASLRSAHRRPCRLAPPMVGAVKLRPAAGSEIHFTRAALAGLFRGGCPQPPPAASVSTEERPAPRQSSLCT